MKKDLTELERAILLYAAFRYMMQTKPEQVASVLAEIKDAAKKAKAFVDSLDSEL